MPPVNSSRRASINRRSVAIDFGPTTIRAVELQITNGESRVVKHGSAPLSASVWEDGARSHDELARGMRAALGSVGIAATAVTLSLPRRFVTLKYAKFPMSTPEMMRGMVENGAHDYIPFPIEEVVLGHQVVSEDDDNEASVMIVAARRVLVEDLLAAADKAGLETEAISVSALALGEHLSASTSAVAIIEIDGSEVEVCVSRDGMPVFARSVVVPDSAPYLLAEEAIRSLSAYQNEHRSWPLARVWVASDENGRKLLEERLAGLSDAVIAPLPSSAVPTGNDGGLYAAAVGAAMEGVGAGVCLVNLLPASRTERKAVARRRLGASAGFVALIALVIAVTFFLKDSVAKQEAEYKLTVRENKRLDVAKKALIKVKTTNEAVTRAYRAVSIALSRNKPTVDMMKALSDAMPKSGGVYLTQIAFERGGNMVIHGNSKDENGGTDLALALQASGAFLGVRLSYVGDSLTDAAPKNVTVGNKSGEPGLAPQKQTSFQITCKVTGADQKEPPDKAPKSTTTVNRGVKK